MPHSIGGPASAWRLPTASQRLVDLDHAYEFCRTDLLQHQFGRKKISVSIESIELCVHAALVTGVGEALAILERTYQFLLLDAALSCALA